MRFSREAKELHGLCSLSIEDRKQLAVPGIREGSLDICTVLYSSHSGLPFLNPYEELCCEIFATYLLVPSGLTQHENLEQWVVNFRNCLQEHEKYGCNACHFCPKTGFDTPLIYLRDLASALGGPNPDIGIVKLAGLFGFQVKVKDKLMCDAIIKPNPREIHVKGSMSHQKQRFSIAHELGHFFLSVKDENWD